MTPQDAAQLIETRQFEKHDIYTAAGVPPIMGGDNEKTTLGNRIGRSPSALSARTLKPHLVRWEEELNCKLFRRAAVCEFEISVCCGATPRLRPTTTRLRRWSGPGPGWMSVNETGPYRTWRQSTARTNLLP